MTKVIAVGSVAFNKFWLNLKDRHLPDNYVAKEKGKNLSDVNFTQEMLDKLNGISDNANKYVHPESGVEAGTYHFIKVDENGHIIEASNPDTLEELEITEIPAELLTGTIDMSNLPSSAIERCVVVDTNDERFALTTNDIQTGDVVKVNSTMRMFFVIDDTKLNTEEGYCDYVVGTAQNVDWIKVLNTPETFTPYEHTHTISEFTDAPNSIKSPSILSINNTDTENPLSVDYDGSSVVNVDIQNSIISYFSKLLNDNSFYADDDVIDAMMGISKDPGLYNNDTFVSWENLVTNSLIYLDDDTITDANTIIEGDLYIPNTITKIGDRAFSNCKKLTSINIPNSVTSIGQYGLATCNGLTSINIPDSVQEIGEYACSNCPNIESVKLPSELTNIPNGLFYKCQKLKNVNIPDSVIEIGGGAFHSCIKLETISIPANVTNIGLYAFYKCSGLTSITVDPNNTTYDSRNNCNAIIETSVNKLIVGCNNTIIPNSVTSIGEYSFDSCIIPESFIIPDSVTRIEDGVFFNCTESIINIPNSVLIIGNDAFYNVPHVYYNGTATGSPWGALAIN